MKANSERPDCAWSAEWENANPSKLAARYAELVTGIARSMRSARVCAYAVTKGRPTCRTSNVQFAPRLDADPKGRPIVSGSLPDYA